MLKMSVDMTKMNFWEMPDGKNKLKGYRCW